MNQSNYIKRVLRWWWLFLLSMIIAATASYYASLQMPKVYKTTTTLLVGQVFQTANPTGQDFSTTEQLAESYAQIVSRQPILQAVIDNLGLNMSWTQLKRDVLAETIPNTQLLAITVENNSPELAVAIADEIAYQLILQSPTSPENQARTEHGEFVKQQLASLETRISRSEARLEEIDRLLDTALSAREIQNLESEKRTLQSVIRDWQSNYISLLSFFEGGDTANYLTIIDPAQLPVRPVSPNVFMNVALAAFMGLSLALGAAILLEYLDDTIKSPDDLTEVLGVTALGSVVNIKGKSYKEKMAQVHSPFSPVSEAYRLIRTNIQFMAVDKPAQLIAVTSASPGEGKSTTIANLGVIMAQAELRTIIVDADLRQPTQHTIFRVPNTAGLTDLLLSKNVSIEDQLVSTGHDNLKLITSGPLPPNSSEILNSHSMLELIEKLRDYADVILFDTPPILMVTDALVLSSRVDGTVLVIKAGNTRRAALLEALDRLKKVDAHILGSILNQISPRSSSYYYSSHYSYSQPRSRVQRVEAGMSPRHWWQRIAGQISQK